MKLASPLDVCLFMPHPPILASSGPNWEHLTVQRFQHRPCGINVPAMRDHLIVFNLGARLLIEKKHEGGRIESRWAETGHMSITPIEYPLARNARSTADLLFVHMSPQLVADVAEEVFGVSSGEVRIVPRFAVADPLLNQLAQFVHAEVEGGAPGVGLMADGLSRAMALSLLRRHSSLANPDRSMPSSGLSGGRLKQVIDHMQAHLGEDLPISAFAAIAGLSPSHFARAFREATGQPPHRYLVGLRIAKARNLLETSCLSVVNVGLECGFQRPTHFATAFRNLTGLTPRAWRAMRNF